MYANPPPTSMIGRYRYKWLCTLLTVPAAWLLLLSRSFATRLKVLHKVMCSKVSATKDAFIHA